MSKDARSRFPRQLIRRIQHDLEVYPVVAVFGARQVGKTTLARELGEDRGFSYLTLDDRDTRDRATNDPEGLLADVRGPGAVIDEVQRAPDLLLALKAVVDREQRLGRFILTGSNQPRMSASVADSLVGRVAYRTLRPLTLSEQRYDDNDRRWSWFFDMDPLIQITRLSESVALSGALDWREAVAAGGMPRALAAGPVDRELVLEDYAHTFANRDIREVLGIESPERFEMFLRLTAARTALELNMSRLSRDLGVPLHTVRRWLDALERSYLVTRVPPFSRNAATRVTKSPKVFFVDSGLALAAAREREPTGFHLETLVVNDMLVWRDDAPGRAVSHWRSASGPEVDIVVEQDRAALAVEIKTADHVGRADARHLTTFFGQYAHAVGGVLLSSDPDVRLIADRVIAAPWWAVL